MKSIILSTLSVVFLFSFSSLHGQYQIGLIPRVSPDKATYQKVGYTDIEIKYGSPKINGRTLEGSLIPYDEVWRAGANNATTISFSEDVIVDNKKLAKGEYSLFVQAKENDRWTIVFSNKAKQWGAFKYDEADDALRVEVIPRKGVFHEELIYSINQHGYEHALISLNWGNIQLDIEVATAFTQIFINDIQNRVNKSDDNIKWVVYVQGAEYLINTKAQLDIAGQWISKAEQLMPTQGDWHPQYYPKSYIHGHLLWIKAKLFAYQQEFASALASAQKLKNLENDIYLQRNQEKEKIDSLIAYWKEESK